MMENKLLKIEQEILNKYPQAAIGYILVDGLSNINNSPMVDSLKYFPIQGINRYKLELQNLPNFQTIANWRKVYSDCGVKPKTYKSSIESLLRRFIQKKYNPIIPVVDFYNYISARYILPAGGYDIEKIEKSLILRYAKSGDKFMPLGGSKGIEVTERHIVYADENVSDSVVCWLWNHKDSKRTMLTETVDKALFLFDSIDNSEKERMDEMMKFFEDCLVREDIIVLKKGVLNIDKPDCIL